MKELTKKAILKAIKLKKPLEEAKIISAYPNDLIYLNDKTLVKTNLSYMDINDITNGFKNKRLCYFLHYKAPYLYFEIYDKGKGIFLVEFDKEKHPSYAFNNIILSLLKLIKKAQIIEAIEEDNLKIIKSLKYPTYLIYKNVYENLRSELNGFCEGISKKEIL